MVIMGLDPGGKRIGVALSDPTELLASPLTVLRRTTLERDLAELRRLAEANDVEKVLVGLPLHMSGEEGNEAERARSFAAEVEAALGLPVELVDERLSSVEAERQLMESGVRWRRRKERLDAVAAAVILQAYLDTERYKRR